MSLWSKLFGSNSGGAYAPWSSAYFKKRVEHEKTLLKAPSLQKLHDYEVVERHAGGMGEVLVVRRPGGGLAALKRIKAREGADSEAANRQLADEATILFGLSYSYHLLPEDILADFRRGTCTIVLPYCCGGSLADRARFGPIPWQEAVHYAMILAAELKDLHDAGILHLDLKPANVLFDRARSPNAFFTWRPLLADYGLSELRRPNEVANARGGTPAFMAPEQMGLGVVDARADLWSLGATIYSLIGGRAPIETVQHDVAAGQFPSVTPLHTLQPQCPIWLSDLTMRCLALDPADRPKDAAALFDGFLQNVRVTTDFESRNVTKNGSAGPEPKAAKLEIAERFLLSHANRLGRVHDGPATMIIDTGWVGQLKQASTLYEAGTVGGARRGLLALEGILGDWSDPSSLLGQFAANPGGRSFTPLEIAPRAVGGELRRSVQAPVPKFVLLSMLDLKCMCLVTLVEELGRKADVENFGRTVSHWVTTNTFGNLDSGPAGPNEYPAEKCLCRIAQGLRFIGDSRRALELLAKPIVMRPTDQALLFTALFAARDVREFAIANNLAEKSAAVAQRVGDWDRFTLLFAVSADLAMRAGNTAKAVETYEMMLEKVESPDLQMLAYQARARLSGSVPPGALDHARRVIETSDKLEQWIAAGEVAFVAGDWDLAAGILRAVRRDPRLLLPTNQYDQGVVQDLEARLGRARP